MFKPTNFARAAEGILRETRGTSAIEFAILCPIFITFVLGIMEASHAYYSQGVMRYAIQEVARTIMVQSDLNTSQMEELVVEKLSRLHTADIVGLSVSEVDNGDSTMTATLSVSYKFDMIIPMLSTFPMVFESKTQVVRESSADEA